MITDYEEYCLICGTPTTDVHHLVFGRGMRQMADIEELTMPICRECHQELHDGKVSKALSRMLGQMYFEKRQVARGFTDEQARENFRRRFHISYL